MIDVLVFGKDQKEHVEKLAAMLEKFQKTGLTFNNDMCQFWKGTITFLGQIIHGSGVHPNRESVRHPEPCNSKERKCCPAFLGNL